MTFTWQAGRQLASLQKGTTGISYTYGSDGTRLTKTVNGVKTSYTWDGAQLVSQTTTGGDTLYFTYHGNSRVAVEYKGNTYYYIYNLQGDVVGLVNSSGTSVVSYTYDAWGNPESISGSMASTLGAANPFRYRSYYFDTESGLYYLMSRYYDPVVGRFLNADSVMGVNQDMATYNLFVYCGNNPVSRFDSQGTSWWGVVGVCLAVVAVAAVVVLAAPVAAPVIGAAAATALGSGAATVGMVAASTGVMATVIATTEKPPASTGGYSLGVGSNKQQSGFSPNSIAPAVAAAKSASRPYDEILGKYGYGDCNKAAAALQKYMISNGQHGAIITLRWPEAEELAKHGGVGCYVISKTAGRIGENGFHMGVLYRGKVYCNIHPSGMGKEAWIADFESYGPKYVSEIRF